MHITLESVCHLPVKLRETDIPFAVAREVVELCSHWDPQRCHLSSLNWTEESLSSIIFSCIIYFQKGGRVSSSSKLSDRQGRRVNPINLRAFVIYKESDYCWCWCSVLSDSVKIYQNSKSDFTFGWTLNRTLVRHSSGSNIVAGLNIGVTTDYKCTAITWSLSHANLKDIFYFCVTVIIETRKSY